MQPPSQGLQASPIVAAGTYVSDLKPTFVLNGWGSGHLDKSNGEEGDNDGNTLSIRGKTYAKGLGVHANSEIDVPLNGKYSRFVSDIGVDDEKNGLGSVGFQVLADGQQIFDSGVLRGTDAAKRVDLDVSGKQKLKLIVNPGPDGIDNDHANWADALLTPIDGTNPGGSTPPAGGGSGGSTPPADSSGGTPLPPSGSGGTTPPTEGSGGSAPIRSGNGNTYYVATNGNDSGDGSIDRPWKTVNRAVSENSAVKAGDTILVQPGTYTENVVLGKSGNSTNGNITLKANGDVTLVDPNPTGGQFQDGVIQSTGKTNWTIDGFTIKNASWSGIALKDARDMVVQNNRTLKSGSSGIIVLPGSYYGGGEREVTSSNIKVLNNTIDEANDRYYEGSTGIGGQEALSIWGVDGFEVAGNKVTNGRTEGIDIKVGSRNGTVHHNEVSGSAAISGTSRNGGPAIYLDGNRANMFNIDVYANNVYNNRADGIAVADEDIGNGAVSDIRIYDNTVRSNGILGVNGGEGISIRANTKGVEVFNNTVDNNAQGFYFDGGDVGISDIKVYGNSFTNSKFRNGFVGNNVNNLTLENNKLSKGYGTLYDKSGGQTNLQERGNTTI